jgi:hypothetical protein
MESARQTDPIEVRQPATGENEAMFSATRLQSSRFEFKYIIDEPTAAEVRRFILHYVEPDAHTVGREGIGYPVHSLYLDSTDFFTCRATLHGDKNRFKLRLRFYDDRPDSPVFLEIKRRVSTVILKQRAMVRRKSVSRLLVGEWLEYDDLVVDDLRNREALHTFCTLCRQINARAAAYTSYMREGYEPRTSNVYRVTFDRDLRAGRYANSLNVPDLHSWARPKIGGIVLELKFTDRFPQWMEMLVETFNLNRISMPKYVECVTLINGGATYEPLQGAGYESDLADEGAQDRSTDEAGGPRR